MRQISQNANENQTGISLWTLEDVIRAQLKAERVEEADSEAPSMMPLQMEIEDEDEFEGDDEMLAEADLELCIIEIVSPV